MRRVLLAFAVLLTSGIASPAVAQERILSYDIEVEIRPDGTLDLLERIRVRAEGSQIRRGIYRDFPTRYQDRAGNRVRVDFEVVSVEKNGAPEPWFTESLSDGTRVNTGNDDFLPVPAEYEYTLRYRTTHQLGFFDEHDELYWNAIGTGWIFPIERASVVVRLPVPVSPDSMSAEGYTGSQGEVGDAYSTSITGPGTVRYETTRALAPREGFTIVLTFPKGIIPEPTQVDRAERVLRDNLGVLVALAGFFLLLAFCLRQWTLVGRDPQKGVVIPQYEPRPDFTPAACRYLTRMGYDTRAFSGDILALAVAGRLAIHRDEGFLKDDWTLQKVMSADDTLPASQRVVLSRLFPGHSDTLVLRNSSSSTIAGAQKEHRKVLEAALEPRFFRGNSKNVVIAVTIGVLTAVASFLTSGGFGIPVIGAIGVLMVIVIMVFTVLVKAPTAEGRRALDDIEGLKLYLTVAERDELAQIVGPGGTQSPGATLPNVDAARYEALLPYAVALEVEDAWTKKFTLAVGAAAAAVAASHLTWYHGSGPITNLGSFGSSIGSSLSSTIASSSTPPGSSSGAGGGGFSGGGGGGGGGGGR